MCRYFEINHDTTANQLALLCSTALLLLVVLALWIALDKYPQSWCDGCKQEWSACKHRPALKTAAYCAQPFIELQNCQLTLFRISNHQSVGKLTTMGTEYVYRHAEQTVRAQSLQSHLIT